MTHYSQFDRDTLNREYSPSSCVDDINIYIQQYIDQSKNAHSLAIEANALIADLAYGEKDTQCLDVYTPLKPAQKKLMVYIHGGYWQELSKQESSFAATNFQKHGFHYAVIDYTLAPDASLSDIVEENRRAIAWLYKNAHRFGYSSDEIYVCGSSAGGHLAMIMLQTDWSDYVDGLSTNIIQGVCAVSGIYDLQPLVDTYVNDPLKMDIAEAKANSPALLPLPKPVPVVIAYGEHETAEFKRQSQMMSSLLQQHGFNTQYHEISQRNHFDVITDLGCESSWLFQQAKALMTAVG